MSVKHKKFSPEEDEKLLKLVNLCGPRHWRKLAASMEGRTGRQCRDRYSNYLAPSINRSKWTLDEDRMLVEKVNEYGFCWSKIAHFFSGRTSSSLKNRWYFKISPDYMHDLKDRKKKKQNSEVDSQVGKKTDQENPINEVVEERMIQNPYMYNNPMQNQMNMMAPNPCLYYSHGYEFNNGMNFGYQGHMYTNNIMTAPNTDFRNNFYPNQMNPITETAKPSMEPPNNQKLEEQKQTNDNNEDENSISIITEQKSAPKIDEAVNDIFEPWSSADLLWL